MTWTHLVVLVVALIVGAYVGTKYPPINVLAKVLP